MIMIRVTTDTARTIRKYMVHILRYLKDSMENEPDRTWNRQMHGLVREMIHAVNQSEEGKLGQEGQQ